MSTEREYEAGTELDPEAAAFVESEAPATKADDEAPAPRKERTREPDYDASQKDAAKPDPDEERAARMGWSPKDQWRGPADKWVDAKTFVERANPAILLERMDKMAKDHESTVERLERMNQKALERQQKEAEARLEDLKRQRDELIEKHAGDAASIKQINTNYENAVSNVTQQAQGDPPDMVAARDAWLATRPEFKANRRFAAAAFEEMGVIGQEMQGKPWAEQFAELDKRLADDFPHIYRKQPPANGNGAPPADARQMDGVRISAKKSTNYAARLSAAAKTQGERFVRQGLFKDIEEYAKEYADE